MKHKNHFYKFFFILLPTALFIACSGSSGDCSVDAQCAAGRICAYGTCSYPLPQRSLSKSCWEVDIDCNCGYAASAFDGLVTSASLCVSGQHQFHACTGSCGGSSVPWSTTCFCPL